ncbi:Acetaldehyde dehydrogenase 4 [Variovorax sp. PBS-H4]|uniref:acetaldehyde dehydrogenase (acetylating) n=1 Tax=Variovorax sp. PBS-H4 TaxID=434008 RepID=UPI00131610AC|nr:Acetaldehyde dehydrogenase 4 [Variovorax sp. PBS-H4]
MEKIACAIIGSGNIGTDLAYKLLRSPVLKPVWMIGIDERSDGLQRARALGLKTSAGGVDALLPHVAHDAVRIAFDATSAYVHAENSRKLNALNVQVIDLTPAAIGPMCLPTINLAQLAQAQAPNVNMISCAGQATIPMVKAVTQVQDVGYAEIVASLSSRSVGPGTRANLDEFTYTTSAAICAGGGARKGKAMVVINPADPPVIMRNTIYCLTDHTPEEARIRDSVLAMVAKVQEYVPGYRLVNGPVFDGSRVAIFMEVAGAGDYLPRYAGNLDIMTAAAARTAEAFARTLQREETFQ